MDLTARCVGRVLLVDDVEINRRVVRAMLAPSGLSITEARDGREALDMLRRARFDVVLMDCEMPVLDGYGAAAEIRRREGAGPRTPIIALSASALPSDVARARAAGMDAHVAKPIAVGQLLAAIGAALAGTHASSPAVAPQADDALDRGRLGQLRRLYPSDRDFRAFADSFTDDARAGMDRLATAARAGDAGAVRRSAHALRGPCSLTGAHRVEALLADIERRCGQGDVPDTAAIEVLERSYRDAGKALAAQLG